MTTPHDLTIEEVERLQEARLSDGVKFDGFTHDLLEAAPALLSIALVQLKAREKVWRQCEQIAEAIRDALVEKDWSPEERTEVESIIADTISTQAGEIARLREVLQPFASFSGGDGPEDDMIGALSAEGKFCLPDGHGFECVWADENDGGTVDLTAGQFRRARAALQQQKGD